jgi:hypothetical protein
MHCITMKKLQSKIAVIQLFLMPITAREINFNLKKIFKISIDLLSIRFFFHTFCTVFFPTVWQTEITSVLFIVIFILFCFIAFCLQLQRFLIVSTNKPFTLTVSALGRIQQIFEIVHLNNKTFIINWNFINYNLYLLCGRNL